MAVDKKGKAIFKLINHRLIGGHFAVSNVPTIGSTWHAHSYMTPIQPLLRDLIRRQNKAR